MTRNMEAEDNVSLLKSTALVAVLSFVVFKVISAIIKFRAYAKVFNQCPGETDFHWLYGNLHKFPGPSEAGIKYDTEVMEKRPRFSRVWAGVFVPVILIYHPDLVRKILKSSAPKPRGGILASVYEMGLGWLGEGLLISNGAQWARNRRLLTPAFHFDILRPYIAVKNRAADVLLDKIQQSVDEKKSFEAFQTSSLCLLDILLQCAFNHQSHCQTSGSNNAYIQNINELVSLWSDRSLKPWLHIDFLYRWTPHGRRWFKLCDYVHSVSEELIDKRLKVLKEEESGSEKTEPHLAEKKPMLSFVDILLTAKDQDGKGMTRTEIRNEADTFLFEGFDTTTSCLSWMLYSMARWPQHQKKVQEEVDAILKDRDSDDILWEDLSCLPFTSACLKETMRNYSTVPFIERETTEDMDIDGHIIPPHTFVGVHLWCLHHNPSVWDRPHDYLPERFFGDNITKMDPFQFVPFSAGSRNCIGQNFALHELKIVVAKIFHRFSLSLDPDHEVLRCPFATFKAEKDIKLLATPRSR